MNRGAQPRKLLIFWTTASNKTSIAALAGALEILRAGPEWSLVFAKSLDELEELGKSDVAVVALSFSTLDVLDVNVLIPQLRKRLERSARNCVVLAGGPHPSGDPLTTLALGVDFIIRREGEVALPSFLRFLDGAVSPSDVENLLLALDGEGNPAWNKGGPVDLDRFPGVSLEYGRWSAIEISRGCPWACRFCQTSHLLGARMRHRGVARVLESASGLRAAGARDLRFITPDSLAYGSIDGKSSNLDRLGELLEGAAKLYGRDHVFLGSFPSEIRPETATLPALRLLRAHVANDGVIMGVQSGSDRILAKLNRGHTYEQALEAAHRVFEADFGLDVDFIFGIPGETKSDVKLTLAAMEEMTALGARVHSHTFIPLAGTPMYNLRPERVAPAIRSALGSLNQYKLEYGSWAKQENKNFKVYALLEELRARGRTYSLRS